MLISLNSVDKVVNFVNAVSRFDEELELKSGIHAVDAKSIMGVFCLDLTEPIELVTDHIKSDMLLKILNDFKWQKVDKYLMKESMVS